MISVFPASKIQRKHHHGRRCLLLLLTGFSAMVLVISPATVTVSGFSPLLSPSTQARRVGTAANAKKYNSNIEHHRIRLSSRRWSSERFSKSLSSLPQLVSKRQCQKTTVLWASSSSKNTNDVTDEICTIQILMSDTGGGHRASANALRDAFDVLHPGKIQCDIVDIFTDYGPVWPYNDYVAIYKLMAAYPITWDIFYHAGATDAGLCFNNVSMETICFDSFSKCLSRPQHVNDRRADMVVSVHPLTQDLPLRILAHLDSNGETRDIQARTTPFATVVTDLGSAHPTWFNPGVDKCFVPSDALRAVAKDRQLRDSQIVQYGLPIRKGFWAGGQETAVAAEQTKERGALRKELGLDTDLPTVLVVGGGDGMGGIVDIGKALGEKLGMASSTAPTTQLVVVCGKNQAAQKELNNISWGKGVKVYAKGFVDNMDEWMQASDTLVTKAGPGTIAEASICGLPCMMFSYLPGQEEGNIPFVEDSGFGRYSGDPTVIANTVSQWLESPEKLAAMKEAALAAARPTATLDIARDLADMVFAEKQKQKERTAPNAASALR